MSQLKGLFEEELSLLRTSAKEFGEEYPALTSHLAQESNDPDVEAILKGVAYLTAQIRLDEADEFPIALQSLTQIVAPIQMQPKPVGTILEITPQQGLLEPYQVASGHYFDSVALVRDDQDKPVACRFSNCWPVTLLPLTMKKIVSRFVDSEADNAQHFTLTLDFDCGRSELSSFSFENLRLYIDLPKIDADCWISTLANQIQQLSLITAEGERIALGDKVDFPALSASEDEAGQSELSRASRVINDYVSFSEKFGFFDIDVSKWKHRMGTSFSIEIKLDRPKIAPPTLGLNSIKLNCVPATNRFSTLATPVSIDVLESELDISVYDTALSGSRKLEVISIGKVESIRRGRAKNRVYENMLQPKTQSKSSPSYAFFRRRGPRTGEIVASIGIHDSAIDSNDAEILRIETTSCNGKTAELAGRGDICIKPNDSNFPFEFTNITNMTRYEPPSLVTDEAWQIVSDQVVNTRLINDAAGLKAFLINHIAPHMRDSVRHKIAAHQISSIEALDIQPIELISRGRLFIGREYRLSANRAAFTSEAEYSMFGSIVNSVFQLKNELNSISRTRLIDTQSGEELLWKPMIPRV